MSRPAKPKKFCSRPLDKGAALCYAFAVVI